MLMLLLWTWEQGGYLLCMECAVPRAPQIDTHQRGGTWRVQPSRIDIYMIRVWIREQRCSSSAVRREPSVQIASAATVRSSVSRVSDTVSLPVAEAAGPWGSHRAYILHGNYSPAGSAEIHTHLHTYMRTLVHRTMRGVASPPPPSSPALGAEISLRRSQSYFPCVLQLRATMSRGRSCAHTYLRAYGNIYVSLVCPFLRLFSLRRYMEKLDASGLGGSQPSATVQKSGFPRPRIGPCGACSP